MSQNRFDQTRETISAPHTRDSIREALDQLAAILTDCYQEPEQTSLAFFEDREQCSALLNPKEVPQEGLGLSGALDLFSRTVLPGVVKTWHPGFFNQMSAGSPLPGVLGEALSAMINSTLSTFEASPIGTVMEHMASQWMADILGMAPGSSGIFLPGGSMANLMGLVVAREQYGKESGNVVFCSDAAHYSVANAIKIIGMKKDSLVKVPTNERGEMDPEALEQKILWAKGEGYNPMAVLATTGLTVTGGFDPLGRIAEVVERHPMHLHVDAAFGGGMALTSRGPQLFEGIRRADTVSWDAHKWLYAPLASSVLLTPDKNLFKKVFASGASYLFHGESNDFYVDDQGQYTPLCGKPLHALPLWLMIQTYGLQQFKNWSEERLQLTLAMGEEIEKSDDLELLSQPISPVICFRYKYGDSPEAQNAFQDQIRARVRSQGRYLFNITTWRGTRYFRMILINPLTTWDVISQVLTDIRAAAQSLQS